MTILDLIKVIKSGKHIEIRYESDNTEILEFWSFMYFEGSYLEPSDREMIETVSVSSFDFEDETLIVYVEHI